MGSSDAQALAGRKVAPLNPTHGIPYKLNRRQRFIKRTEDLLLASLALFLLSGLIIGVGFAVKITSPGPILFRQRRNGLGGQEIVVLKFRTMAVQEDGVRITQARRTDARITRLGGYLRRTYLDELPQLFNVLRGDMSLVGPRPHAVAHNEMYSQLIHGYMSRHAVKPGMAGWAQVNGWRGETDTIEKMTRRVEHDLEYIERWSLWFDIRILVRTVFASRPSRNAY